MDEQAGEFEYLVDANGVGDGSRCTSADRLPIDDYAHQLLYLGCEEIRVGVLRIINAVGNATERPLVRIMMFDDHVLRSLLGDRAEADPGRIKIRLRLHGPIVTY